MTWQKYKLNLRNSLHYKHVDTKKEVNSKIYLLLSLCSPPSQSHYFLIPIFPQSFRSTVADGVWPLCKRPMQADRCRSDCQSWQSSSSSLP